jgi:protein SCO1/2
VNSLGPPQLLPLLVALALGACAQPRPAGNLDGAAIGGDFALVDERGRPVTSASYDGQWRLMYFGFTYCPDVCPVDAAKLGQGLRAFEASHPDAAARVQPLFVTVDPERDTPTALAEFTDNFHPRLVGLTGTPAQVEAALKAFRVYARRVPGATEGSYSYDHLAVFYLLDPEGRPVEFLAGPTATPEAIAAMLERFVA